MTGVQTCALPISGAIQAATLVLDGGHVAGSWSFLEHSRVVVNANYGLPGGSWSGSLGALQINSGAAITLPSGLSSVDSVENAGTITVANGGSLNLAGTASGAGRITLASTGSVTLLNLTADTTLAGTGQTVLGDRAQNIVASSSGSRNLTIGSGHTVRGGGNLGSTSYGAVNIVNQGTLLADAATAGMRLYVGSFDNSAGTVQVAAGTTLNHSAGALSGGTLQSLGAGATLAGSGSFSQAVLQGGFNLLGGVYTDITLRDANTLGNGGSIGVAGTLTNTGSLSLASTGGVTLMNLAADTTLAGTGQTVLGNRAQNIIASSSGNRILTIAAGHTVRGGGNLGSTSYGAINLVNKGTVLADAAGGMRLYTGSFDNTGGTVQVTDGSFLVLSSGSLSGGTVQGTGAAYLSGSGVYRDTTLAGNLKINNSDSLQVAGTLTNTGVFNIAGSGSVTLMNLAADTTLAGTGQTVLGDRAQNFIASSSGNRTLTIGSGHTVRGGGNLGSTSYGAINIVNQGTILADAATAGMRLYVGSFDNSAGTVQVAAGTTLNHSAGALSGGTLQSLGAGATLAGSGSFSQAVLQGGFNLLGGVYTDITLRDANTLGNGGSIGVAGTLTNTGSLSLASTGGVTLMNLAADTTLAGTGQTVLGNRAQNIIASSSGNRILTIAAGHTVRGGGNLGSTSYGAINLVNKGTVLADAAGGMRLYTGSFDNTGGTVQVTDGSFLVLSSGSLSGGTVQGTGAAYLSGSGVYRDTTLAGNLKINNSDSLQVAGTLTNTGVFNIAGSGSVTLMNLAADTTLAGTGQTVLGDRAQNFIASSSGNRTLTIGSGHTVRGGGNLGSTSYGAINIVNQGTILADAASGMSAYVDTINNAGGTLQVATGSRFALTGGALSGGSLQGVSGARISGGGVFSNFQLTGALSVGNSDLANIAGTVTNDGVLSVDSTSGVTRLYLAGDTTLKGSGQTVLGASGNNHLASTSSSATLTIGSGHTVRGGGNLGSISYGAINLINQGTILADAATGMSAYVGTFNNAGGTLQVANNSRFTLAGGTLSGGSLHGTSGARIGGGGVFSNFQLTGALSVGNSDLANIAGTITNDGVLSIDSNSGVTRLYLAGDTTLHGTGQTVLGASSNNHLVSASSSATLTIGTGHTLRGGGNLGSTSYGAVNLVNQGTVLADNGVMRFYTGQATDNQGRLEVISGAELNAQSSAAGIVQTTAGASTIVNGLLRANTLTLNAGTLQGSGTVQADVLNLGGTINAGNSPGKLSITGDLTLGDDSLLLVEVAGATRSTQFDWLAVTGNVTLDGDLRLDFLGYTPQVGQQFSFLTTSSGSVSGRFDNARANGWGLSLQYDEHSVTATVTAVPEPGTWALMLLGAAGLGAWVRRQQAATA